MKMLHAICLSAEAGILFCLKASPPGLSQFYGLTKF